MGTYMFVVRAVPLPENKNFDLVAGANVHVWVMDESLAAAKNRAVGYISDCLWNPQYVETELEIDPSLVPQYHKDEVLLYYRALEHSIAADFLAWPKVPGQPGDPVIVGSP